MKRLVFLIFILHASFFTLHAQTISDVFTTMPDSIMPLLTANNRRDMADFLRNNMQAKVRNRLNDYVELTMMTKDYLRLELSAVSTMEMKLLQTKDTVAVVCLLRTVAAPCKDSQVEFYDTKWQRLQNIRFPRPTVQDFFCEIPDSVARDVAFAVRVLEDLCMIEIVPNPEDAVFELRLCPDELEQELKDIARPLLRNLRYRWNGRDFVAE
ncbi:MAG: DUF3256 family protein [Bacteroidaceae bacterium]|nr:DUF3256 family protein [Bacteroidaceae bacterium]